jgi:hypothetical protein
MNMPEKPIAPPKPVGVRARVHQDIDLEKMYSALKPKPKQAPAK